MKPIDRFSKEYNPYISLSTDPLTGLLRNFLQPWTTSTVRYSPTVCIYYRSIEAYAGIFIPFDYRPDGCFEGLCASAVITVAVYVFEIG